MQDGYELALAAALGGRLDAALVEDVRGAQALLDGAGPDGGTALLAGHGAGARVPQATPRPRRRRPGRSAAARAAERPARGARAGRGGCSPTRGWSSAWRSCPRTSRGIAVTRAGRVWFARLGRGAPARARAAASCVLARRNERDRLIARGRAGGGGRAGARGPPCEARAGGRCARPKTRARRRRARRCATPSAGAPRRTRRVRAHASG